MCISSNAAQIIWKQLRIGRGTGGLYKVLFKDEVELIVMVVFMHKDVPEDSF